MTIPSQIDFGLVLIGEPSNKMTDLGILPADPGVTVSSSGGPFVVNLVVTGHFERVLEPPDDIDPGDPSELPGRKKPPRPPRPRPRMEWHEDARSDGRTPISIQQGGNLQITLTCTCPPHAAGPATGTLTIHRTSAPEIDIPLSAILLALDIQYSGSYTLPVGGEVTVPVSLSNGADLALRIDSVRAPKELTVVMSPVDLPPRASATVNVQLGVARQSVMGSISVPFVFTIELPDGTALSVTPRRTASVTIPIPLAINYSGSYSMQRSWWVDVPLQLTNHLQLELQVDLNGPVADGNATASMTPIRLLPNTSANLSVRLTAAPNANIGTSPLVFHLVVMLVDGTTITGFTPDSGSKVTINASFDVSLVFDRLNFVTRRGDGYLTMPAKIASRFRDALDVSVVLASDTTGMTLTPVNLTIQPGQTIPVVLQVLIDQSPVPNLGTRQVSTRVSINGLSFAPDNYPTLTILEPRMTVSWGGAAQVPAVAPGGHVQFRVNIDLHGGDDQYAYVRFAPRQLPAGVSMTSTPAAIFAKGRIAAITLDFHVAPDAQPGKSLPIVMDWVAYGGEQIGVVDLAGNPVTQDQTGMVTFVCTILGTPSTLTDGTAPFPMVELQLQAAILLGIFTRQFARVAMPNVSGLPFVLDHLEFGRIGLRQNSTRVIALATPAGQRPLTIPALQVTQDVSLWLAARGAANPPVLAPRVTMVLDFQTGFNGNGIPTLGLSVNHLEGEPQAVALLTPAIQQFPLPAPIPFDVSKMAQMPLTISNFGLSAVQGLQHLLMRFEAAPPTNASLPGWTDFFAGRAFDHLGSNAWSLLLEQTLIDQLVVTSIQTAIVGQPKIGNVRGANAQYTPTGGLGFVRAGVRFDVDVPDPCPGVTADTSIGVFIFSPEGSGVLQTQLTINFSFPNFLEVVCVELIGGILGAFAGVWAGAWFGPVGAAIGAVIGLIAGLAAVAAQFTGADLKTPPPNCIKLREDTYLCTRSLNLNDPTLGNLQLLSASGLAPGLLLIGAL